MSDDDQQFTPEQIAKRRDAAVRKALNTPPKPLKETKGQGKKKRQDERPTASGEK